MKAAISGKAGGLPMINHLVLHKFCMAKYITRNMTLQQTPRALRPSVSAELFVLPLNVDLVKI